MAPEFLSKPGMTRSSVLFLCTGNSCRSQMAEGWMRHIWKDEFDVFSAGLEAHGLNPSAVQVMQEAGVDISGQQSNTIEQLPDREYDYVITVCGQARENCPLFPARLACLHLNFGDQPRLARDITDPEQKLLPYRRVRDEIRQFVERIDHYLNLA